MNRLSPYLLPGCLALSLLAAPALASDCGETNLSYDLLDQSSNVLWDNAEGTPGPRRLVTDQTSHIISRFSKRLIMATPLDIDSQHVVIDKLSGSVNGGETRFVVCKTSPDGQVSQLDDFHVPGGWQTIGQRLEKTYTGLKDHRLSLRLLGNSTLGKARFRIDLRRTAAEGQPWVPNRQAPDKSVTGFADLHVHQAAELAFAGGWLWGSHREGPLNLRLPACSGDNHATLQALNLSSGQALIDPHYHATEGAPSFKHWPAWNDIKHQQVSAEWLKQAHDQGLNLMVASAVNNQWLSAAVIAGDKHNSSMSPADMETVKRQLHALKQFDQNNDWYTIVRDPWEARRAIAKGEMAIVLAVEVSDLMPSSDGPWRQQLHDLYDMGVRSVQIAHQTNNRFSGAAYHRDLLRGMSQLKAHFEPGITFATEADGEHNAVGLSPEGYALLDEMIRLNMLIDLSHLPLKTIREIYQHVASKHGYYPLFKSHTRMDPMLQPAAKEYLKEFVTTPETLSYVRQTGGMLGLRTGEEPMRSYTSPRRGKVVENHCDGSLRSWTQMYQYADDQAVGLAVSSDFNGFITQLGPRFGPEACPNAPKADRARQVAAQGPLPQSASAALSEFDTKGLAHMGLLPAMLEDMRRIGADTSTLDHSAETFVKMWERAYDPKRGKVE